MNARTIEKLRRKFILVAMLAYVLVMSFMGICINLSNYFVSQRQIRQVLGYILDNDGMINTRIRENRSGGSAGSGRTEKTSAGSAAEAISGSAAATVSSDAAVAESAAASSGSGSETSAAESAAGSGEPAASETSAAESAAEIGSNEIKDLTDPGAGSVLEEFSPEFHYSARFFTATFDEAGEVKTLRTTHINELTDDETALIAGVAYRTGNKYGRLGNYYYQRGTASSGDTMIVLLNCASQIRANQRFVNITFIIFFTGLLIALIIVWYASSRVIAPEIENVRRQKQFITNASHELKTPLAVIRANTEIEEMMNGESEWTQSTMRQIDRLDGLVQNLVMISRAAEREDRSVMAEIDVSKQVEETVKPYRSLAQQDKKELVLDITPDVRMVADESKIRQLVTLLVDNAFKYCDSEGRIRVSLHSLRKGKTIRLVVANTFKDGANVNYSRFFERFYREDEAHSVDRGGYGIGLSIAESICQQYGGSINVGWRNGEIAFTCLLT